MQHTSCLTWLGDGTLKQPQRKALTSCTCCFHTKNFLRTGRLIVSSSQEASRCVRKRQGWVCLFLEISWSIFSRNPLSIQVNVWRSQHIVFFVLVNLPAFTKTGILVSSVASSITSQALDTPRLFFFDKYQRDSRLYNLKPLLRRSGEHFDCALSDWLVNLE